MKKFDNVHDRANVDVVMMEGDDGGCEGEKSSKIARETTLPSVLAEIT